MTHAKTKQAGFTLIELMLSMTFITTLLLAIAFLTIHISGIYQKGISIKAINESGLSLSEDLQRTIAAAPPFNLSQDSSLVQYVESANLGGRLCLGTYSYVWNYGQNLRDGGSPYYTYSGSVSDNETPIRFIKIRDQQSDVCSKDRESTGVVEKSASVELLGEGDRNLAIYDFEIFANSSDQPSSQALYAINFTLGTDVEATLDSSNGQCKPPSEADSYEDYCAVNKFSIITRASSIKGGM